MFYQKDMETISREDLEQLQIERLQTTLNRVYQNVHFYKNRFDSLKINIEDIRSKKDIGKLPFTTKEDLRKSYPYDMFAVPLKDIIRIHSTSGTTGQPVVLGYTRNDVKHWEELIARGLYSIGINQHDLIQIAFSYGFFTGGLGFHYGAEKIGASVIPSSSIANAEKQLLIMKDYKTSVLISTPNYALYLAKALEDSKIHPESLVLKKGLFGAEPWSEKTREILEKTFHIDAYDCYGISEIIGPGVAQECECKNGLHVNEDHFIVEVIDPNTLKVLEHGQEGELVFTTLTKEGFPLIRYRTGDLTSIIDEKCACGRTLCRIKRIKGRNDEMIFINDSKFLPSDIERIITEVENVTPNYLIILDRRNGLDVMEIKIEVSENLAFDKISQLQSVQREIEKRIETLIEIKPKITLVEMKSLKFNVEGKVKRVQDNR